MRRPDIAALMARIYRHYPRGIRRHDPRYSEMDEWKRLEAVFAGCAAGMEGWPPITPSQPFPMDDAVQEVVGALRAWVPFKQELARLLPDCVLWDRTVPWHEPNYWCDVSRPGFVLGEDVYEPVICLLSALAPVYMLCVYTVETRTPTGGVIWEEPRYSQFPERFRDRETKIAGLIETTFRFDRLTEDTLLLPVPDVEPYRSNLVMGEAKLIDCLFTSYLP